MILPPGARSACASSRLFSIAPSSSFTAIRSAWNTLVAGCMFLTWKRFGMAPSTMSASSPVVCHRLRVPGAHDGGSDFTRPPLFTVAENDICQQLLVRRVHDVLRAVSLVVEPHVKPLVPREAEAAAARIEMIRGDAEVIKKIVHRALHLSQMLRNMRKIIVNEINSACIAPEPLPCYFQDLAVPVKSVIRMFANVSRKSSECPPSPTVQSTSIPAPRYSESSTNRSSSPGITGMCMYPTAPSHVLCRIRTDFFSLHAASHTPRKGCAAHPCRRPISRDRPQGRSMNPGPAGTGYIYQSPRSRYGHSDPGW